MRKDINCKERQFLKAEKDLIVKNPTSICLLKQPFRYYGTYMCRLGCRLFLDSLKGGLKAFFCTDIDVSQEGKIIYIFLFVFYTDFFIFIPLNEDNFQ